MQNVSERTAALAHESGDEETVKLLALVVDVADVPSADGALEPG